MKKKRSQKQRKQKNLSDYLNEKSEYVSKCQHENKFYLSSKL